MYLLLNRDEVLTQLAKRMLSQQLKKIKPEWTNTNAYLDKMHTRMAKSGLIEIDFGTVNNLLRQDLQEYKDAIVIKYKDQYRPLIAWLEQNFNRLNIDRQYLIDTYVNSDTKNFVKTLGQQLTDQPVWSIAGECVPDDQPVVIRNIINNEALLRHRLANHLPFWFIDSGYTNFLSGKKLWHRLIADHLHYNTPSRYFPADRLGLLPSMPAPWRTDGDSILVIENSEYHYQIFGTSLEAWRQQVETELRKHTNRRIEFRSKELNRKTRNNLYEHLKTANYYCVVVDASAAAIEAVWAGTPVITLNRHISSAVARNNLADINNLYRGPIGDWLCALTYSQFTKKEMFNGTALKLIEKYHV
jgi:hypothetical protein